MVMVDSRIKDKKIVIWGVGILQSDLEGVFVFSDFLYYVDHKIQEKNCISVSQDQIYAPEKLREETSGKICVILCTEEPEEAITRLRDMGYGEDDYILGEELLAYHSFYEQIREREISIWGTGTTYLSYETEIRRFFPNIARFLVTEKDRNCFQGKDVVSLEEFKEQRFDTFVIITSIYYQEIYKNLTELGLLPGRDFVHVKTLMSMCSLSMGIDRACQFTERKKDREDLLVVLAGYKEFVWESVFQRLKAFAPLEMDVCIVTSGLENAWLKNLCEKNQWSYLSTSRNNVSMAVNTAIWKHPQAKYIYKMDEDMFLTEGVFERLKDTYLEVERNGRYEVGFVTPLIPINGYGYVRLLEIFDAVDLWIERFGELKYANLAHHNSIWENPDAARFMWGEGNPQMDNLDRMQKLLSKRAFQYSVCSIRYSIGFILFHRNLWIRMGGFPTFIGNMGVDEEAICQFCLLQSYAMVVAENAVAGHLAFGPQNKEMEKYYFENKEKFRLP